MPTLRTTLTIGACIVAAAAGGGAIANAATTDDAASDGGRAARHSADGTSEKALTGATASKVRAAALARVPGTVDRLETNDEGSAPYEAHIRKSDGSEVEVQVSKAFKVASVDARGDHDRDGDRGGDRGGDRDDDRDRDGDR